MHKTQFSTRLATSAVLGAITWGILAFSEAKLRYVHSANEILQVAMVPGLLIAGILYPEGVHTGRGIVHFGYVVFASGILFYAVLWFGILSWIRRRQLRSGAGDWRSL